MRDKHNATPWRRLLTTAILVVAGVTFVVGSFALAVGARGRAPGVLTEPERTEIAAVVGREVVGPIGSVVPMPDGTAQVFVGSGDQPGGQLVRVERHKGSWRVVQRALLY
jgi:hypothetical protein